MRGVGSGNDGLHDTIDIVKDVIVPKSQYEVAVRFEIGGPDRVLCDTLSMLPTVQLDDEACSFTAEVDYV